MSGQERCRSLDRAQQKPNNNCSGGNVSCRSPNRSPLQCVPSTPEIFRQYKDGDISDYAIADLSAFEQEQFECPNTFQYGNDFEEVTEIQDQEPQREYFSIMPPQFHDLPAEFLDAFEEPTFYEINPNESFEEVMCTMATPPTKPMVEIDKIRERIAEHIEAPELDEGIASTIDVNAVRKRIADMIADSETKTEQVQHVSKIPTFSEDPRIIPPHPKDPKDIVAIVRRAKAIARLKALEEAEAAANALPKGVGKERITKISQGIPPAKPGTKAASSKKVVQQPPPKIKRSSRKDPLIRRTGAVSKMKAERPPSPEHPPDYVPPEFAAAILRARKHAGLKTRNPKLLPRTKAPPTPKAPTPPHSTPAPPTPSPPTYENIIDRAATIRARAEAALKAHQTPIRTFTPKALSEQISKEELDEFEALEELYDVDHMRQCKVVEENHKEIQERIAVLQRKLLESPQSPDLDEFEALEKLYDVEHVNVCPANVEETNNELRDRIADLQQKLFQSPTPVDSNTNAIPIFEMPTILRYEDLLKRREYMAAAAALAVKTPSSDIEDWSLADITASSLNELPDSPKECRSAAMATYPTQSRLAQLVSRHGSSLRSPAATPISRSPDRSRLPVTTSTQCPTVFGNAYLQNIEVPDFDVDDIPEFAFSAETLADAGFMIDNQDVSLGQISLSFDEDISMDEYGLENVTSPELCDLSISGSDMALEPDYPLEITGEEVSEDVQVIEKEEVPKAPGFFTSVVSTLVDGFRNMFTPTKGEEGEDVVDLFDTSLPSLFETSPPALPTTEFPHQREHSPSHEPKASTPEEVTVIPPHPKDPKDYAAIVKRAQAIQKKKAQDEAEAHALTQYTSSISAGKNKREVTSTIPKPGPPPKKKGTVRKKSQAKVYPPGEYSPRDAAAVARARYLAGFKNRSALLNPERAARIAARMAEKKFAEEAEIARIEALPPVERMRTKMALMKKRDPGEPGPRPSIEMLGTLEAIRESLPIWEVPKKKWRPRLKRDQRSKNKESLFTQDFGRILDPTARTVKCKRGWKKLDVMSPLTEEPDAMEEDFMLFSPLRPHEGQLRLQYLKQRAARRAEETILAAKEAQAALCSSASPSTQQKTTMQYSPITLQSPSSPRTEQTRRERVTTQRGENGGKETIRDEMLETSIVENGEVHTSTRQVTTKTDEYGNVTCHIQEGKGVSGEEVIAEDIAGIEPPDFLDSSDIPPPRDSSIPTPSEIIERIRLEVQKRIDIALPTISPTSPGVLDFPEDLPDEKLFDTEIPEFKETPQRETPQTRALTPIEKDERLYAWGEKPPVTPPPSRTPTPKAPTPRAHEVVKEDAVCPPSKLNTHEGPIVIPAHPKDPKDYAAMVKRAQAIQKFIKQREAKLDAALPPPHVGKAAKKDRRIPISRYAAPKDAKKPPRKRMVLKKQVPKAAPKTDSEDYDMKCPAEPPPFPENYAEHVARARLIHGLKNRTAALNPEVAAKLAVSEAAKAAYEALPEHEKIKIRMEKIRRIPKQKRHVVVSADTIGTLAAIRANMPSMEEISEEIPPAMSSSSVSRKEPTNLYDVSINEIRDMSLDEFEFLEAQAEVEAEANSYNVPTPTRKVHHFGRKLAHLFSPSPSQSQTISTARPPFRKTTLSPTANVEKGADVEPGTIYDEMQDFRLPISEVCEVLNTSNLMPETPKTLQQRLIRIKEAQERPHIPRVSDFYEAASETPAVAFSPFKLMSPSGAPVQPEEYSLPISSAYEGECLVDIDDRAPQNYKAPPRQFEDLEDMPFDELEFEVEPSLANISDVKAMTPPPRPSDIISRVRSKVQQQVRDDVEPSFRSPGILEFPEELPDKDLLQLSAPSFVCTPQNTPLSRQRTPRVSLPMAWGEVRPATPKTPPTRLASPQRMPTSSIAESEVVEEICRKDSSPEGLIVIPPHPKDPKDYAAMVKRAQAIYKLKQQQETEAALAASPPEPTMKKGRAPISRWVAPPSKKNTKLRKKLVMKKRVQPKIKTTSNPKDELEDEEDRECPAEPPPLPENYTEHVARARLIHGLKNMTAALNPKVAARLAAKKAAEEAAKAAYAALPEHEKIKLRMERLRKKAQGRRHRGAKLTMEQIAYLEALKQIGAYESHFSRPLSYSRKISSPTPRERNMKSSFNQMEGQPIVNLTVKQDRHDLGQRMVDLEQQLLEAEIEAIEAAQDQCPLQPVSDLDQMIEELQQQQLETPSRIDPRERYRQVVAKMHATPKSPVVSPIKTPEIRYSPVKLLPSPSRGEEMKRATKSTTQITNNGDKTIKEQVIETSEIVNGELQHITKYVTTTTDPSGNVTCQINESKHISARDTSADLEEFEDLGDLRDVEQPSFLDITPVTPLERPRPRDIIDRVRKEIMEGKGKYRPEVPTGQLVELRTPPRMLPLPEVISDNNLLDLSSPRFSRSPPRTPVRTPVRTPTERSPIRTPDMSIPQMFFGTPKPPTPPLPPAFSPKQRKLSPEGPIIIPPHPKDPQDYATMVRRARKIQQLIAQKEAERKASEEAASLEAAAAAKTTKRVPISRWPAPPHKKATARKRIVMKKHSEKTKASGQAKSSLLKDDEEIVECPAETPAFPNDYLQHIARARHIAGLKNRTAALNPKVAAREAAIAAREAARLNALNAPPPSPIKDYGALLSKISTMREQGAIPKGQPSIASEAYLNALREAMQVRQEQPELTLTGAGDILQKESPVTRYKRIMTEFTVPPQQPVEVSPLRSPRSEDIHYTPLRLASPRSQNDADIEDVQLDLAGFEGLKELDDLEKLEEPSFLNVSESPLEDNQYFPLTPPQSPTEIIRRIRDQLQQRQQAAAYHSLTPPPTPEALKFPEDLPEEEIFELSAPSFQRSPVRPETPIASPNISLPQYFEITPPPKPVTPRSRSPQRSLEPTAVEACSPQLPGICPGLRAKTPEGHFVIPPHPKDPKDVAAIIRRAQLIQKLQARQMAEEAKTQSKKRKGGELVLKRVPSKGRSQTPLPGAPEATIRKRPHPGKGKGRLFRKIVLKKKAPPVGQPAGMAGECPQKPPFKKPSVYREAIAEARRLAALTGQVSEMAETDRAAIEDARKDARKAALEAARKVDKNAAAANVVHSSQPKYVTPVCPPIPVRPPGPPDYAYILERATALRAAKSSQIPPGSTACISQRTAPPAPSDYGTIMERAAAMKAREQATKQEELNRQRLVNEFERIRKEHLATAIPLESVPVKTPPPAFERLQIIKSRKPTTTTTSQLPYSPVKTPELTDLPQYQRLGLTTTPPFKFLENEFVPDIGDVSIPFEVFDDYEMADDNEMATQEEAAAQERFNIAERIEKLKTQLLQTPKQMSMSSRSTDEDFELAEAAAQEQYEMCEALHNYSRQQGISQSDADKQVEIYDDEMTDDFKAMEKDWQ